MLFKRCNVLNGLDMKLVLAFQIVRYFKHIKYLLLYQIGYTYLSINYSSQTIIFFYLCGLLNKMASYDFFGGVK